MARARTACELLSAGDMSGVLGGTFTPGRGRAGAGWIASQCEWASDEGTSASMAMGTSASLAAAGSPLDAAAYVASRRDADGQKFPIAALDGLGDGTGYVIVRATQHVALASQGGVIAQLLVVVRAGEIDTAAVRTLMERALANATG